MTRVWLALGGFGLLIAGLGSIWLIHKADVNKINDLTKQKAELAGYVAGYQKAQATEIEIHVTQDKLNVQVQDNTARLRAIDPKCENAGPLVTEFVSGIERLRGDAKAGPDHSTKP